TAIDTTATIRAAVVAQLQQQPDVPVLVLTDHDVGIDVGIDDPRMVVIAPPAPLKNVGIAVLAARERPAAQVMVEVVNDLPPTAVDVGAEGAAIVEIPPAGATAAGEPAVVTHPITAQVDWPAVLKSAVVSAAPPDGFSPLVSIAGRTAVAYRQAPARQVWVGFDSPQFAQSVDYVIFWSNVFNWLGGGAEGFVAHPVTFALPTWMPTVPPPSGVDARAWPNVFKRLD